jgi:hypothetical protein
VNVVGTEVRRLVEGDGAIVALGEDAVEDDDMEVEVGVEGGAEAVEEGDGADLGVAGSGRAGAAQRGADASEQDAEHVAGETRVTGQEGTDPLPLRNSVRRSGRTCWCAIVAFRSNGSMTTVASQGRTSAAPSERMVMLNLIFP